VGGSKAPQKTRVRKMVQPRWIKSARGGRVRTIRGGGGGRLNGGGLHPWKEREISTVLVEEENWQMWAPKNATGCMVEEYFENYKC